MTGKEINLGTHCWYIDVKNTIERINNIIRSWQIGLINKSPYFFLPNGPNTTIKLLFIDALKPKLCPTLSFFMIKTWSFLLKHYSGVLKLNIVILFWYCISLRYKRPEAYILSPKIVLALVDLTKIDDKLSQKLVAGHIS